MKKNTVKKTILCGALLVFTAVLVYALLNVQNPDKTGTDASAEKIDDEMIIVPEPDGVEKDNSFVDNVLNKFGFITIEDDEIPLASSSFYAKDAGMVPNDPSMALFNANQIIKILNSSNRIIIDDKYYITTPSEALTTGSVEIIGTGNAELIVDNENSSKLFDPAIIKSIKIKDLSIRNVNNENLFLIIYNDKKIGSKVESVDVSDCKFYGNISLYRQYGDTNLDPDTTDFGIGDFTFRNNTVVNTKYSFIVLEDVPVNNCEIIENQIRNFTYKFLNVTITNNATYSVKLYNHISHLKVDSNTVTCDDSWWGDTSSGSYYAFVLFEGNEVLFNNNHVEGMKTRTDFAVYDAYLSANSVNYTNNTWKNNICFAQNKTNNTLLKSKGGGSNSLLRNYTGNSFIVEVAFAERVGQPKENLFVDFISLTQHTNKYNISNNTFDIYDLRFPVSSLSISEFSFCNNTLKAQKASGNLAIVRMDDEFAVNSIDINDNIIDIGSESGNPFSVVKVVDTRKSTNENIKEISIKNNKISASFGYILYDALADVLDFTNNTITDNGSNYSGLAYRGKFTQTNISDNVIDSKSALTFYEGRQSYGAGTKNEVLNIARNNVVSGDNGLHLDTRYNSEKPITYKRTYTFDTQNGTYEFYYTFTLSYNSTSDCAEVTFNDINGKTNKYILGTSDTSSNGSGQYINLISSNAKDKSPFQVRFYNGKDDAVFYITDYNSNFCEAKIETISSSSDGQSIG